ncbi:hypothetical protein ACA910_010481 [Epithemia clementina (nom. ined.)]
MYTAYKQGRAEKNPAEFWYQGEIGFFDFYIIPLAKKLSDCGVFGVSSDEYLSYATKNREEWGNRGQEVVAAMLSKYQIPKQLITCDNKDFEDDNVRNGSVSGASAEQDDKDGNTTSNCTHSASQVQTETKVNTDLFSV